MRLKKILLLLLTLLCFCTTDVLAEQKQRIPLANNGVIDLRNQSFNEELPLNGQWKFHWQQLINPNDTNQKSGVLVNFPSKWTDLKRAGKKLPAFGYATYQLRVLLPVTRNALSIAMPETYCAYKLFINGELVAANGNVSTTESNFIPYWQEVIKDLPAGVDTLNLTLQVANFAHHIGGISEEITICEKEQLVLTKDVSKAIDLLLTGCLFMGGIFFLGLYLVGNKDKAILFFSLFSIIYSYRIVGSDNYVLHGLFPELSWYLTIRLEYISLFLGIGVFGVYTRYLYPDDIQREFSFLTNTLCFVFAGLAVFLPPYYFTQLLTPFLVITISGIFYVPYVYFVAYKRKRPGSIYPLISSIALMVTFSISILVYLNLIPAFQLLSFICYISFFFLQSLILSHRVYFKLRKARVEAEQGLVAKSEFLSTMSHEIRTPLNAVIGLSHLLLKNNPRQDQVEQLDVMLFSANNLLNIVNDILDYNKIEAGKITFEQIEMDIAGIAKKVVLALNIAALEKSIDLRLKIDENFKHKVIGDPTRFSQVITNLVHNAVKFTITGYVLLEISVVKQCETQITLLVKVEDTGIGISKEKQTLIFERFTQADSSTSRAFGGSGLGLAISRRILELQQATLSVNSEEGKGATFYFQQTFDKSALVAGVDNPVAGSSFADLELASGLSSLHILLVEDNPINVLVAKKHLEKWGAVVDVANNGVEALTLMDTDRHNLILMDLQMPVMDGYEASKRLRTAGVKLPIIAFTANLPEEIHLQIKSAGMDDYIVKPFLPKELYRKVLQYTSHDVHRN